MFEVEAKVSVSKEEFKILKERLSKEAHGLGVRTCDDVYYGRPKKAYIRLRKGGGEYRFGIKKRRTIRGIESNTEMEWKIDNASKWRTLLKRLKIEPDVRKRKKSILFSQNDFIIELNHVRLLGYYLEIERLVKDERDIKKAEKELIEMFRKWGFSPRRFEPKSYLELLAHV